MRHLIRLTDWTAADVSEVFELAREYEDGRGPHRTGAAAMFFPPSSLRTRASLERGAHVMGLQPIVFPPESLEKPEALSDVAGYLASWVEILVVRQSMRIVAELAEADAVPVVNAMTEVNHPCEVLGDVFAVGKARDARELRYLFVGADGNILGAWREIAAVLGLNLTQCSPASLRADAIAWSDDLPSAIRSADVIITDGPGRHAAELAPYRVTAALLDSAPREAQFIPCPPHIADREATVDAFAHPAFVGHRFKKTLLPVQQAVMEFCLRG